MKTKALLLIASFALVQSQRLLGQTTQTNACVGSTKLVCQVPANAVILSAGTFGTPQAQNAAFQTTLPINAAVATQLAQLPVPSATVGSVSIRKKAGEPPARWDNLGPILTDRPDTVGRGHLFAGFSYQHFQFNALDGFKLNNQKNPFPIAFTYSDPAVDPVTGKPTQDPKVHYGRVDNLIDFKLDQYLFILTGGVTQSTDLSIIIPINSVSINVKSSDFQAYDYDINTQTYSLHTISTGNQVTSTGSASGGGDISIGLKQMLVGQNHTRPAVSAGFTFRFPTGDSFSYLGSGAMGGGVFMLAEYRAKFAPHMKLAYQWNDKAKVLDIAGGGRATLPGGLQYAFGTDYSVSRKLTLNADLLGSQFINTPYFTKTTNTFNPVPGTGTGVPPTYDVITTPSNTYTTVNFSGGAKFLPWRSFLLYANALIQLNDVGLKANVSPLFGIAYNFNFSKAD